MIPIWDRSTDILLKCRNFYFKCGASGRKRDTRADIGSREVPPVFCSRAPVIFHPSRSSTFFSSDSLPPPLFPFFRFSFSRSGIFFSRVSGRQLSVVASRGADWPPRRLIFTSGRFRNESVNAEKRSVRRVFDSRVPARGTRVSTISRLKRRADENRDHADAEAEIAVPARR